MKKIMFSDKIGLTEAVLKGKKTMTRRIVNPQPIFRHNSLYKVGEVVAIAQSYEPSLKEKIRS